MARVQLFLSTVSAEFLSYRDRLRQSLTRPNVEVKVQEDFIVTGNETLEMLDEYIKGCDGVIHLVGDMTGSLAKAPSLTAIKQCYPDLATRLPLADFFSPMAPRFPTPSGKPGWPCSIRKSCSSPPPRQKQRVMPATSTIQPNRRCSRPT